MFRPVSRPPPVIAVTFVLASLIAGLATRAPAQDPDTRGIVVQRLRAPQESEVHLGDRMITIVRIDLSRYRARFLTARDGEPRPLHAWAAAEHLVAGVNAGMFLHNGRPLGFVQERGEIVSGRRPASFRAAIAFDPIGDHPRFAVGGAECPGGLDQLLTNYSSALQANRLLIDCDGRPVTTWRTRRYSAALLGADEQGRAVLVHVRTPYRMHVLARMIASLDSRIRGLVYMEGGPEATVFVDGEGERVHAFGSYEDGFFESDENDHPWNLPNVVGFVAR